MVAVASGRSRRGSGRLGEAGTASLELVLLVPVLVLLALFVLWAGRGGRAGLTADLAAEEAATAAALCCEEGSAGDPGREAVAEDVLGARPGLEFLCIGGPRPDRPDDDDDGQDFVRATWLKFDNTRPDTRGVGVLDVRFVCETDGAVAPLRGAFPTVEFYGQAQEVVIEAGPPAVGLGVDGASEPEGDDLVFEVEADMELPQDLDLVWRITHDTEDGTEDEDFVSPLVGTVTIKAGTDSIKITVRTTDDDVYEGDETFTLTLDPPDPSIALLDPVRSSAIGTIIDNENPPVLAVLPPDPVGEGGNLVFTVLLADALGFEQPIEGSVTVNYGTADGTAEAPGDYTEITGTLTFPTTAGTFTHTVAVVTNDDTVAEGDETLELRLSDPSRFSISDVGGSGTGTIEDNEPRLSVVGVCVDPGVLDACASEGDGVVFEVTLVPAGGKAVTVDYRTTDPGPGLAPDPRMVAAPGSGCAATGADDDYEEQDGTLTFAPAETTKTVTVVSCPDVRYELDEDFWLELHNTSDNAHPAEEGGARGRILNDDGPPVLSVAPKTDPMAVDEGDALEFVVTIDAPDGLELGLDVEVAYTLDCTAGPDEIDGCGDDDYDPPDPPSPLTFTAAEVSGGVTKKSIVVQSLIDAVYEVDETVEVTLTDPPDDPPPNFAVDDSARSATGTIRDATPRQVFVENDPVVDEGQSLLFTICVDEASDRGVTVAYATGSGGSATAGDDYVATSGTVTITAGAMCAAAVGVVTNTDSVASEPDETVVLELSVGVDSGAVLSDDDPFGIGTIRDITPHVFVENDPDAFEGQSLSFRICLDEASSHDVTVDYATVDGTANADDDYVATSGERTITAGARCAAAVEVATNTDTALEDDETVVLELSEATGAGLSDDPHGIGTIRDGPPPSVSVAGVCADLNVGADLVEACADEGRQLIFRVSLDRASDEAVTVRVSTPGERPPDTATLGEDYWALDRVLRFEPGRPLAQTVTVQTLPDTAYERPETLRVVLSDVNSAAGIGDGTAEGTIFDVVPIVVDVVDDCTDPVVDPNVEVDACALEGGTLTFRLDLNRHDGQDVEIDEEVKVDYVTTDVTATDGEDYHKAHGFATFDVVGGLTETSESVDVDSIHDTRDEADETFKLDLSDVSANAIIGDGSAVGMIIDDDTEPTIEIHPAAGDEGTTLSLSVTLSHEIEEDVTFTYSTVQMSGYRAATAGLDYVEVVARPAMIAAGDTETTVDVELRDDDFYREGDERFQVWLSGATGARIGAEIAVAVILDEEPSRITVFPTSGGEGTSLTFLVLLNRDPGHDVTFRYRTVQLSGEGAATRGTDYGHVENAWTFRPTLPVGRAKSVSLGVPARDDEDVEGAETFLFELFEVEGAVIATDGGSAVGTILDDDVPRLCLGNGAADEGDPVRFTMYLCRQNLVAEQEITARYDTFELDPRVLDTFEYPATPGDDYVPVESGLVTINAGQREGFFEVATIDDEVDDAPKEGFGVRLSDPVGAWVAPVFNPDDPQYFGDPAYSNTDAETVGWIYDDDPAPTLSVGGVCSDPGTTGGCAAEGEAMAFTVSLSEASGREVAVDYQTPELPPAPGRATAEADYVPVSGRLVFAPGTTEHTFEVATVGDGIEEPDEVFQVRLRGVMGAQLADPTAVGTIIDDDQLSIGVVDAYGDEGKFLSFVVTLSSQQAQAVTIDFETVALSGADAATPDVDYVSRGGTLTILAGAVEASIHVAALPDGEVEEPERFQLRLSNPSAGLLAPETAIGIINDVAPSKLAVSDPGADEGEPLNFVVSLDEASTAVVTVDYTTADGTAKLADGDYTPASGSLTFAPGVTALTVPVATLLDFAVEQDETVQLVLSAPGNASIVDERGTGTIRDLPPVQVRVSDVSEVEGEPLRFVVSVNPPIDRHVTVDYATVAGPPGSETSAVPGVDYTHREGTLTVFAGESTTTLEVPTIEDVLDEAHETFSLRLSNPTNAALADNRAEGTILDDDRRPELSVRNAEAAEDAGPMVFEAVLSEASARPVTVLYYTADGTAGEPGDYTETTGTLEIAAGDTSATVRVPLVDDSDDEDPETFLLHLHSPTNAGLGDAVAAGRILDDDGLPSMLVGGAEGVEGSVAVFTVRLTRPADGAVTVDYATADGTAKLADGDYTETTGTLEIGAGDTSETVSVPLVDDTLDEDAETFRLVLTNPSGADLAAADAEAVGTILDNDGTPTVSVADAPAGSEADAAVFTVRLSSPSSQPVTVSYAARANPLAGGAAAIPVVDFEAVSATLEIPAGDTAATVAVPVVDDSLDEHTETFWLRLLDASGADVLDGTAVGTIVDDDPLPALSVADSAAVEAGTVGFAIGLSEPSGREVRFTWTAAPRPSAGDRAATPGEDFEPEAATVVLAAGSTTATAEVQTLPDDLAEFDETFLLQLTNPANASLADGGAVGTIVDDDGTPRLTVADIDVVEDAGPATFTVSLSRASSRPVTVDYATEDGTAAQPGDYTRASDTLTIPAGDIAGTVVVPVVDDTDAEDTETFTLRLSNPAAAALSDADAVAEILDDDGPPRITVADARAEEGDGTIDFAVTLSHDSADDVTVRYATFDGTAAQPGDYTADSGPLVFPAGTTSRTVPVQLADDLFTEDTETFTLRLSDPAGATVGDGEALGIILDDDVLPIISATDVSAFEDEGTVSFRVTLNRVSDKEVRVDYTTCCAGRGWFYVYEFNPDEHFVSTSGTLVFPPGALVRTVDVTLIDNDIADAADSQGASYGFALRLFNPVNAVRLQDTAYATIWDDDAEPYVYARSVSVPEDVGEAVFTVALNRVTEYDVTVDYETRQATINVWYLFDEHATAGEDYTYTWGTAEIPAGSRRTTVAVPILDDTVSENTEGFELRLTNPTRAQLDIFPYALAHIVDDDGPVFVFFPDVEAPENAPFMPFRAELSRAHTENVTVDYEARWGTATVGDDYVETSGRATITAGERSVPIPVPLLDDKDEEGDEFITMEFRRPVNAAFLRDRDSVTARGRIIEDDLLPAVSVADTGGSEGGGSVDFAVELRVPSPEATSVRYQTLVRASEGDAAATPGEDYVEASGLVEIPAGDTTATISVPVVDDAVDEFDETFLLLLSDPVGLSLNDAVAIGTVIDDDPGWWISDAKLSEAGGSMQFVVVRDDAGGEFTLAWSTAARGGSATGGAACTEDGADFVSVDGTAVFAPSESRATLTVEVCDDSATEGNETLVAVLTNVAGRKLVGVGTVLDDDDPSTVFVVNDPSAPERDELVFEVALSEPSGAVVTVPYATEDLTADDAATAGVDYEPVSGALVFRPGEPTTQTVTVRTVRDTDDEGDERLLLRLGEPEGAHLGRDAGVGTILDGLTCIDPNEPSETMPTIRVVGVGRHRDLRVGEGDGTFNYRVEIDSPICVDVNYGGRAERPSNEDRQPGQADFWDFGSGAGGYPIPAGSLTAERWPNITIREDEMVEPDETFEVVVRWGGYAAQAGEWRYTVTIVDNDGDGQDLPFVYIYSAVAAPEGDTVRLPVDVVGNVNEPVTVSWSFVAPAYERLEAAQSGTDFDNTGGMLTFTSAGRQFIEVSTVEDAVYEHDEWFSILPATSGGRLAMGPSGGYSVLTQVYGRIVNDDHVCARLEPTSVIDSDHDPFPGAYPRLYALEGDSWPLTVALYENPGGRASDCDEDVMSASDLTPAVTEVPLEFRLVERLAPGTATSGVDYQPARAANALTVTVPAGGSTGMVTLATIEDEEAEQDEHFVLQINEIDRYGTYVDNDYVKTASFAYLIIVDDDEEDPA